MQEFIYTCGIASSGKSTWCQNYLKTYSFLNYVYLNPDSLRAVIGKDESDQTINGKVFSNLFIFTDYILKIGGSILYDATSYSKKNRKTFIEIARKYKVEVVAVNFNIPLDKCVERNNNRDRKVPFDVIKRQFNNLEYPELGEECDKIIWVNN